MEDVELGKVLSSAGHEDFVEYFIFPDPGGPSKVEDLLLEFTAAVHCLTEEYIWQRDSLQLSLINPGEEDPEEVLGDDEDEKKTICFHGVTRIGENVEDEWFITWVFLQLTKKFPGSVVRILDNDGEFLLIEAAEELPDWASSDAACRKRVYIHNGSFHLIPKSMDIANPRQNKSRSMIKAVKAIRRNPGATRASEAIQSSIKNRIGNYPEKMFDDFHRTNLMLPHKLAVVLSQCPSLVAPAVNAFYFRDPIELKTARLMKTLKPSEGLVKTRVLFTKCLYAMLSKQDFRPDPRSGWSLPRPTSKDFKAHSLGAKLTTGFEVLLQNSKNGPNSSDTEGENTQSSPGYAHYLKSLKTYGYFQDYLEGSKPYRELELRAQSFYRDNLMSKTQNGNWDLSSTLIGKLNQLLGSVQVDVGKLKHEAEALPPDDDDSWMDVTLESLDEMLQKQFKFSQDQGFPNPQDVPGKLKEFMSKMAEVEGVDIPTGSKEDSKEEASLLCASPGAPIDPMDFRADDFVSAMDKLLIDLGKPDGDWDASEDDDESYSDEEGMKEIFETHGFKKDSKLHVLMDQMDKELSVTEVGKSFIQPSAAAGGSAPKASAEEFEDVESFEPVNIDMNALQNMLKSFQNQELLTGPSTNLLKSVGFDISKAAQSNNNKPSSSGGGLRSKRSK